MTDEVIILYRPVGPKELQLIQASGYRKFPPRLPEQPIFYPVLNEEYANAIARDWNAGNPSIGSGFVTKFAVKNSYLSKFRVQKAGSEVHQEYWIPAEELSEFNANIVGEIEVIREFHSK
jgi:hypothetical protein